MVLSTKKISHSVLKYYIEMVRINVLNYRFINNLKNRVKKMENSLKNHFFNRTINV